MNNLTEVRDFLLEHTKVKAHIDWDKLDLVTGLGVFCLRGDEWFHDNKPITRGQLRKLIGAKTTKRNAFLENVPK